jgi:hypothetical protein
MPASKLPVTSPLFNSEIKIIKPIFSSNLGCHIITSSFPATMLIQICLVTDQVGNASCHQASSITGA